jgi:Flp pilus assembly protein TadG
MSEKELRVWWLIGCCTSRKTEFAMRAFKRMSRDENGAVAMLFALAFIPLLGFVGAALDYARASQTQSRLQASLDAAVLIGARDNQNLTAGQLEDRIRQAVIANMGTKNPILPTDITVNRIDKTLIVSGKAFVSTVVMGLVGQDSMEVTGKDCTRARQHRLDGLIKQDE